MAAEGGHFVDFAYKWPRSGHFEAKRSVKISFPKSVWKKFSTLILENKFSHFCFPHTFSNFPYKNQWRKLFALWTNCSQHDGKCLENVEKYLFLLLNGLIVFPNVIFQWTWFWAYIPIVFSQDVCIIVGTCSVFVQFYFVEYYVFHWIENLTSRVRVRAGASLYETNELSTY